MAERITRRDLFIKGLEAAGTVAGVALVAGATTGEAQAAPAAVVGNQVNGLDREIKAVPVNVDRKDMPKKLVGEAPTDEWYVRLVKPSTWNAEGQWKGSESFAVARLNHSATDNIQHVDWLVGDGDRRASGVFRYRLARRETSGLYVAGLHFQETWNGMAVGNDYRKVAQEDGSTKSDNTVPVAAHIEVQSGAPVGLYDLNTGKLEEVQIASKDGDVATELPVGTPIALATRVNNDANQAPFEGDLWVGTLDKYRIGRIANQFEKYVGSQGKDNR